ncbi:hypothetical protein VP01_486g5 [Puccinia sorghi]|uniref:Uncharacterized protein n=1 Tax=Puccinia sorghi TaxID=27349 RepID=A0A0L6UMA7_9BASI|nr:hypothetical protein VP01_486g5 [Puccinia sorghi]
MTEVKDQIPDLSRTNFTTWKQRILGHCQQLGLEKYLTNANPPAGINTTVLDAFNTNQSKTAGILISNMGTANYNLNISTKDFLYAQQPLTIEIVKETEATAMKASVKKTKHREYCSNGKHNPKASHPKADCWQLQKKANLVQENDTDNPLSRPSSLGFHLLEL